MIVSASAIRYPAMRPRCSAAAAASPGSGFVQYSGAGKSGSVLFGASPAFTAKPGAKKIEHSSSVAPSPGSGSVSYTGPGKVGTVSFAPSREMTLKQRLAAAGLAGLVAYGLSNTLYYTGAFLLVWFNVVNFQRGQGFAAAAQAVAKALAVVWAGSQVTKVPRAAAALLAVPIVDSLLSFIKTKFNFGTKRDAFLRVILPGCILFAIILFGTVTLISM